MSYIVVVNPIILSARFADGSLAGLVCMSSTVHAAGLEANSEGRPTRMTTIRAEFIFGAPFPRLQHSTGSELRPRVKTS